MDSTFDPIAFVEDAAAGNRYEPTVIVAIVRREAKPGTDLGQLVTALEARIGELSDAAKSRPDHAKLSRGVEIMRKVAQLLAPDGAEAELADLAEKIRVCVTKSDNYATTAGQHLREARERCREIGLDFNQWCAQAGLGIKKSRIYQLIGPDPIAAERRGEKHKEEPENVQSVDVAQLTTVEPVSLPQPEQPDAYAVEPSVVSIGATAGTLDQTQLDQPAAVPSLRDLPFDVALALFEDWLRTLGPTQWNAVEATMKRVDDGLDQQAAA
jgi:hypothetical protein